MSVLLTLFLYNCYLSNRHCYKCRCLRIMLFVLASLTNLFFSIKQPYVYININNLLKIKHFKCSLYNIKKKYKANVTNKSPPFTHFRSRGASCDTRSRGASYSLSRRRSWPRPYCCTWIWWPAGHCRESSPPAPWSAAVAGRNKHSMVHR